MPEESTNRSLTFVVLRTYFDEIFVLDAYLAEILTIPPQDPSNEGVVQTRPLFLEGDSEEYRELLTTTYIGMKTKPCEPFIPLPPMMYMRDVIQRAHERLFFASRARPNNIIALGYQRASENARISSTSSGITNRFVNTIVTALQSPEWETLLQRIGADAMLHLLLKTSVFASLPNECLCQLTGEPLIHVSLPGANNILATHMALRTEKRKLESSGIVLPRKRQKLVSARHYADLKSTKAFIRPAANQLLERRTPADISFIRSRMFYARLSRDPDTYRIVAGFPFNHILNRLNPSYFRKPPSDPVNYRDPDPREQARHRRELGKYIFPLQFGLSNVFCCVSNRNETYHQPDFSDRDFEIKLLGRCKTPKRLKEILPLLDKMVWRHGKCGYKPLRDKVCPSKITTADNRTIDSRVILEMISENSIQMASQPQRNQNDISIDSAGNSILPQGLTQARTYAQQKPRFVDFACSHAEVFRYVLLITKIVIPKQFWGCKKNFKLVQRYVKEFISGRRFETLTLHQVLQGFSTAECDWLMPPGPGMLSQTRVCVTDALKRRELLEEFMFWYFDSFVVPLVKTTFYVTNSSAFRNQVLYFRQDDWEVLCAPLINQLSERTFQEIEKREAEEILRQRKLGFSFVRLLPKDTGVRPIVNLRRRSRPMGVYSGPEQSINQILQATFQILTYEKHRQPDLLGASAFGWNEIYPRLREFKGRLSERYPPGKLPKLYFVKVDVQACFDTIEQSTLLNILKQLISEDRYVIQKYGQIAPVSGKIKRRYVRKAYPDDKHLDFIASARDLAETIRQCIFVDQVTYNFESRRSVMQLLEEHVTESIVKIGQRYYRQTIGIPQGSVLSSILCSFFYGDLEKRKLADFASTNDPECLLLRLIDDYLFVTTRVQKARSFLNVMSEGHPEYGCIISKEKTLTNFDYDAQIMNVTLPTQMHFPWCGLLISMKDLSVMADYGKFSGSDLKDSLTVDKGRKPGAVFVYKMLRLAQTRSHIIFTDVRLNNSHVVYQNIYQNFLMTAAKMHYYIESWRIDISKNVAFIRNVIRQVIRYSHASVMQKSRNKIAKASGGRCNVQKTHVCWLGTHAFHTVLSRKPQRYAACSLLSSLEFELSLPRSRRMWRRFHKLVKESTGLVAAFGFG